MTPRGRPRCSRGEGAGLALIGAYVLAGELAASDLWEAVLARYEATLRPLVADKQKSAAGFGGVFAPKTKLGLFLRNQITKLLSLPFVANRVLGSSLRDRIALGDDSELESARANGTAAGQRPALF